MKPSLKTLTTASQSKPASTLAEQVQSVYAALIKTTPGLQHREVQAQMITAIAEAIEGDHHLMVEAGTGSGKSFSYLLPAVLSSARPIVISTATIALQEQLMDKDIPALAQAKAVQNHLKKTGQKPIEARLVKGRRNYVCLHKLQTQANDPQATLTHQFQMDRLNAAINEGWDGDRNTLDYTADPRFWWEIQSETEDCLGHRCTFYEENPYRLAREDLKDADILVVNHALYFQNLAAGGTLLPDHDVVIFDEAHHLKRYATSAFTVSINRNTTTQLLHKIKKRLRALPEEYLEAVADVEAALLKWFFKPSHGRSNSFHSEGFKPARAQNTKLVPDGSFLNEVLRLLALLADIDQWLSGIDIDQLSLIETERDRSVISAQKSQLHEQLRGLIAGWSFFAVANPDSHVSHRVNWVSVDPSTFSYELKSTPLDMAKTLQTELWSEKTAILTSATLAVNGKLKFVAEDLGLLPSSSLQPNRSESIAEEDSPVLKALQTLVLESPFDYAKQCTLYLPPNMPDPNDPMYAGAVAEVVPQILAKSQGRAFVLFTSLDQLQKVANAVIPQLDYPARVQGELPRNKLIEWFKETPNSVLFASATFWEGIDIPGEALSCVIIDKLPFMPPDDPVNQATVDLMKGKGQDWFNDWVLPQAILKLKQGFGRLIRTPEDSGLVAILDPRLQTKGYGRQILRSLPKAELSRELKA